ncbi:MAG TPA: hypothetical protein VGR21_08475 [Cryptosporangiaceae bacterium]|nr:hypothetical protein [Cryptosporangiaceae bacterium]
MSSLREAIRLAPRFPVNKTVNVGEVAGWLGMDARPTSVRAVVARLTTLPERLDFSQRIVTGTALGGEARYELHRDGTYRYSGFMRATGLPSFEFRVAAVLRSADGRVQIVDQASGEVFGTDSVGPRQKDWNLPGTDQDVIKYIRNSWPSLSTCTMEIHRASELSGTLGTVLDVAGGLVGLFVLAQTVGPGLAVALIAGAELSNVGAQLPGLGGIVGVAVVGGSVLIFGPGAVMTAIVVGLAVGEIVDADVEIRELLSHEKGFARDVFKDSIDFDKVRVTNMLGLGGRPFVAPTLDGHQLLNIGRAALNPIVDPNPPNYPARGQLFIHELTHVWQLQHPTLEDGFVPGWICNGAVKSSYTPGPPGPPWSSFNIEAQASIVDRWFEGRRFIGSAEPMDLNDSYFGYIVGNVQIGSP